jgi:putative glycerol-1-phosphate prenyltransferase
MWLKGWRNLKDSFLQSKKINPSVVYLNLRNMGILSILVDPDKKEAYSVIVEIIKNKDLIDKYGVEIWMGTSKYNFQYIRNTEKILNEVGIKAIIFPGRADHAFCYSKNVKGIFRPDLLNCTRPIVKIYVQLGKFLTSFFKLLFPKGPDFYDYGYLVTGPESTVGRKTGALKLDENGIYSLVKSYFKNKKTKGVYIEQGSGAKEPLSVEVVKRVRKLAPEKDIIVGGGIKSPAEVKNFWNAGANRCVVGTFFEKNPGEMRKFLLDLFEN